LPGVAVKGIAVRRYTARRVDGDHSIAGSTGSRGRSNIELEGVKRGGAGGGARCGRNYSFFHCLVQGREAITEVIGGKSMDMSLAQN